MQLINHAHEQIPRWEGAGPRKGDGMYPSGGTAQGLEVSAPSLPILRALEVCATWPHGMHVAVRWDGVSIFGQSDAKEKGEQVR